MSKGKSMTKGGAIFTARDKVAERNRRVILTDVRTNIGVRWRLELLLPAWLLVTPVGLIAEHPESSEDEKAWGTPVLAHLRAACREVQDGVPLHGLARFRELATNCANYAMGAAAEARERNSMWLILTTMYWLEPLLDVYPGLLEENTHLHHAAYALLDLVHKHEKDRDDVDASARKAAKRLGRAFAQIELYREGEGLFARNAQKKAA